MALGSTQPLTDMNTRGISWGWRRPVSRGDSLATFMCPLSINSGSLNLLEPGEPVQVCTGIILSRPMTCSILNQASYSALLTLPILSVYCNDIRVFTHIMFSWAKLLQHIRGILQFRRKIMYLFREQPWRRRLYVPPKTLCPATRIKGSQGPPEMIIISFRSENLNPAYIL